MSEQAFDFSSLEEEPVVTDNQNQDDTVVDQPIVEEPTVTEESAVEPTSEPKQPYTTEEISTLLTAEDFETIDTSRLSDEGKLVMKAMQKGLTPKLQEAADLRREMETLRSELEQVKPKPQPNDIYEAYDQNPQEVLGLVSGEIRRLIQEDPVANARNIEELRELKSELVYRDVQKAREEQAGSTRSRQITSKIFEAIPDLATKQMALREFAINIMGFSPQELAQETNPQLAGESAIRTIVRINNAYDRFNAGATVQKKEIKPAPTKVEKKGSGFERPQTEARDLIKQAQQTGDWSSVFMDIPE